MKEAFRRGNKLDKGVEGLASRQMCLVSMEATFTEWRGKVVSKRAVGAAVLVR